MCIWGESSLSKKIHIIFFKGIIETLDYFANELYKAAIEMDFDCYMADAQNPESFGGEAFYNFLRQDNCVFITFNQIGTLLYDSEDNNIWEKYGIQIYDIMVDHPRNYTMALINPLSVLNILCIDNNHVNYIKEFYPDVKNITFLAHGGAEEKSIISYEDRKIDVLYMGSCQQEITSFPIIGILEDGGRELYSFAISLLLQNHTFTVEDAILEYFTQHKCSINKQQLLDIYDLCAFHIETYVRRYFKQIAIRELDKLGINVEIYGDNWEAKDYSFGANINIHRRVSSKECNDLAGNAKICLNFMPWFKHGTSERVFNSMLNQSVCVSDTSVYLEGQFTDGENIVFFDLNNPLQMAYDVKFLLDNPEVARRIAQNGYNVAKEQCTWKQRLKEILQIHRGCIKYI